MFTQTASFIGEKSESLEVKELHESQPQNHYPNFEVLLKYISAWKRP